MLKEISLCGHMSLLNLCTCIFIHLNNDYYNLGINLKNCRVRHDQLQNHDMRNFVNLKAKFIVRMFYFTIQKKQKIWWSNRPCTKIIYYKYILWQVGREKWQQYWEKHSLGWEHSRKQNPSTTYLYLQDQFFPKKLQQLWLQLRHLWLIATVVNIASIVTTS